MKHVNTKIGLSSQINVLSFALNIQFNFENTLGYRWFKNILQHYSLIEKKSFLKLIHGKWIFTHYTLCFLDKALDKNK